MKAFFLFIVSAVFSLGSKAQVSLTGALTGNPTTLKGAFDIINAGGGSGNVTVFIGANTIETAQAILTANNYTVLVRPLGNQTIEGNIADALIVLNGTANVVIDGLSQTGANTLTIRNTNTGNIANAIRIEGASANNTIKRCIIEAACNGNLTRTAAVVVSVNNEITTGNIIDSNWIRPSAVTGLKGGIIIGRLSTGSNGSINNTQITNNRIENAFVDESLTNYGIAIAQNANNTVIRGNSIYNSNIYTNNSITNEASYAGINFSSAAGVGSGCVVDSNYIGGSAPNALGGNMFLNSFQRQMFIGISVNNTIVNNPTTVTRNVIRNIQLTSRNMSTISMNPFRGIQVVAANLQAYNNNIVGSETNNSIVINQLITSTGGMSNFGHVIQLACATPIEENFTGGLNVVHLSDFAATGSHGLSLFAVIGNISGINLKNNTIGSAVADNIAVQNNSSVAMSVNAFQVSSTNASPVINIDSNVVRNITATGVVSLFAIRNFFGNVATTSSAVTLNGNVISNLSLSGNAGNIRGLQYDLGVAVTNLSHLINVDGNQLSNFTIPSGSATSIQGIRIQNGATAANRLRGRITNNNITGLVNASTGSAISRAIGVSNDIITTDSLVLAGNDISNIVTNATILSATSVGEGSGIFYETLNSGVNGTVVTRDNIISNINAQSTDNVGVKVFGISLFGNNTITERNRIFGLSNAATSPLAKITGLYLRSRTDDANVAMMRNNMIAINTTTDAKVAGLDMGDGAVNATLYHNSIVTEGNLTTNSYAFYKSATAIADVKNNIFYNASAGSGIPFAAGLETNVNGYTGNNNYFVSPAATSLVEIGASSQTIADWRTATTQDANTEEGISGTSTNAANLFINKAAAQLLINTTNTTEPVKVSDKGMPLPSVLFDFVGNNRSATTPDIGAHEFLFSGVLPLNLLSFSGSKQSNDVLLQWNTANEANVSHFELQRSDDGQIFSGIGNVQPGRTMYSYKDANVFIAKSVVFYRLKSIDIDGQFTYSAIIRLTNQQLITMTVFPNPVVDNVTISGLKQNGTIRLFSVNGKLLQQQTVTAQSTIMNLSAYSKGIYVLQYQQAGETVNQKIVKQ